MNRKLVGEVGKLVDFFEKFAYPDLQSTESIAIEGERGMKERRKTVEAKKTYVKPVLKRYRPLRDITASIGSDG